MNPTRYEMTESAFGFEEEDILNVTARFSQWNKLEMVLERNSFSPDPKRIVVTEGRVGFGERNVLDATARLGEWQEYDVTFDAGVDPTRTTRESPGPVRLPVETFRSIAAPIGEAV